MKRYLSILALASVVAAVGCSSFERTSFNTLSSSKAVLDTAQQDYENRTIPKTACAKSLIESGKDAQTVAVNAMLTYEQVKNAKGDVNAQETVVVADLGKLAPIITSVQGLIGPAHACQTTGGAQ